MKINKLHSLNNALESLVLVIAVILMGTIITARIQNNSNVQSNTVPINDSGSVINGIFTPTAADRFFEAGRKDFEREIDFINNSELYFNGDLLKIDPELMEEMKSLESIPVLGQDDFPVDESVFK